MVGSFTLSEVKLEKRFRGSLPIENDDWQVGVIVGRSGSGKTSIAKQLFPDAYIRGFEYTHKCVLDDFPDGLETGEITGAFERGVCFSTRLAKELRLSQPRREDAS